MARRKTSVLYEVPPEEFTARRNALVRELREAGEADEARRVAALRKPPAPLWAVNQLARKAPGELRALIHATEGLRKAHGGTGDELRAAMHAQREAVLKLLDVAQGLVTWSPAVQRRVQNTLLAAAAGDPDALHEGAVETELEPGGFEGLLEAGVKPRPRAKAAPEPEPDKQQQKREREEHKRRERELRDAERTAARMTQVAEKMRKQAQAAQERAEKAGRAAADAAARALELRRRS